ncbi:hypothetical protein RHS04_06697 [Rhizoctonia solani]|uniref:CCHC-type domain-containing protein n=1 Tax=Rhizoctonia solani TaxID=456999 RepID=A0A8H7LHA2_9AGAM|nr:hypothetical protein RHS04_06697 [Rhizoctonia solani]
MSPKNWELARGGHLRDTRTQRSRVAVVVPCRSLRAAQENKTRHAKWLAGHNLVVGITPPGVVARTVAVAGAKTKGPATSLDSVETRVLQTPARYAGAELPPVDMAAELVPAGSKTVPRPPRPARLSAPGAMLQPAETLKPTSAGSRYAHKYNMLNRSGLLESTALQHPSLKGPQNPEMASLTKMVEITQADSPLCVGPPRCKTEIVVFPHSVGVQKGGGWYYQQTQPEEMTSVTGKQRSFGDSNNSTASKRSRTAPRLASPPLQTQSTSSMIALHLTRLGTPATIINTPRPLQALHSQMVRQESKSEIESENEQRGEGELEQVEAGDACSLRSHSQGQALPHPYSRALSSSRTYIGGRSHLSTHNGAAILTQSTSSATPWVCSPIERNHWATLPGRRRTLRNVLPATPPSSTQAEPASIRNPVQRQQTNRQQDPISAARANMVAFNKEVRKGSATLFAEAVTRANRRQSNKELEARCGPMRDRSANGLLPDDEEDIAATQAFAQGTVPKIASGRCRRIQKQKPLARDTTGVAYQVLVVAKIHLFAYALSRDLGAYYAEMPRRDAVPRALRRNPRFCAARSTLLFSHRSHSAQKPLISPVTGTLSPHAVSNIPSTRSGIPHPYSRPPSRSSQRSVATRSQPPSRGPSPSPQHLPGMEPEPTLASLLEAIQTLTSQVGSLQAQVHTQGQQLSELKAICKETNDLVGDKDQGGAQAKPGPSTGPITPPTHTGGEAHTPGTVRPGLKAPFRPSRGTGFDSEEEEEPRRIKKEPQGTPARHLGSLTPFDAGSSIKRPKMDLPDPYKGDTRGRKATQWLDRMMLWVALHRDQFDEEEQMVVWILYHMTDKAADWALPIISTIIKGEGNPPTTIQALTVKFKEAFADPDAKRAAARKIAALTQTTTTSEYVTEFRNLMAELDWNMEAYIAQFTRGLHWKVKELLSTKDNIPDNDLEAIFAASIKIDNICRENEENRPKKAPAKSPATVATSTTTTRVRLSEDPNYVTPEERDRRCASGLCVKCGQKGHGIKQCPNGWKATIKEVAKVAEEEVPGKE